jgi:glutamyl-tRNA synthetase
MSATLKVSTAISPFPYAAAAIASYTGKAELEFDPSAASASLDLNGEKITSEEEIVLALAKSAGLAEDSSKVRILTSYISMRSLLPLLVSSLETTSSSQRVSLRRLPYQKSLHPSTRWMITSHIALFLLVTHQLRQTG